MSQKVTIGTRGSQLALWQARWVGNHIANANPGTAVELEIIKTKGDKILDVPLAKVGGKGLFVKEIEEALLRQRVDLAVHSMKDMPAEIPAGLCIGAVPERENPADVLISRRGEKLDRLPNKARIGTSSLRRAAQIKHARPDVTIVPLRGNLDTRLRKLETQKLDAIVLAAAGVKRMNLERRITEYIGEQVMLPAAGQGALCIEMRKNDPTTARLLDGLDHRATRIVVDAERSFLHRLEGGCQVPIAAHGKLLDADTLQLEGLVSDVAGTTPIRKSSIGNPGAPDQLGIALADALLAAGAKEILETIYSQT
jgi:hydroxymethylbilane synthase